MKASAVNLATFANALCYRNATPLSVAVLAPCVWGENLAHGGAWQSVVNSATHNTAWRGEFGSEMAQRGKIQWHGKASAANSVWQAWRHGKFSTEKCGGACGRNGQSENGAVFGRGTSLSFFLSLLALFDTLKFLNALFMRFCALFVILSFRRKRKIHTFKTQLCTLNFYGYFTLLRKVQYDKTSQYDKQMLVILSFR